MYYSGFHAVFQNTNACKEVFLEADIQQLILKKNKKPPACIIKSRNYNIKAISKGKLHSDYSIR